MQVKSGMLVAPGIPTVLETEEMQSLADTYGQALQESLLAAVFILLRFHRILTLQSFKVTCPARSVLCLQARRGIYGKLTKEMHYL